MPRDIGKLLTPLGFDPLAPSPVWRGLCAPLSRCTPRAGKPLPPQRRDHEVID